MFAFTSFSLLPTTHFLWRELVTLRWWSGAVMAPAGGGAKAAAKRHATRTRLTNRPFLRFGVPLTCCLSFVVLGCLFLNYAGLQQDEVLFAGPLCRSWRFFAIPF